MNVIGEGAVVEAFHAALQDVRDVAKANVADTGKYQYRYADLGAVLDEVKRACFAQGLVVTQNLTMEREYFAVITELIHRDGSRIEFAPTMLRAPSDAQALGSAASYLKRYSLLSLFGMAPEDDDGKAATEGARNAQQYEGHRSAQELAIHQVLRVLPTESAKEVVADFRAHFGKRLLDMPPQRHGEALVWVLDRAARTPAEPIEPETKEEHDATG